MQDLAHVPVVHEAGSSGCSHTLWSPVRPPSSSSRGLPPRAATTPPCLQLSQLLNEHQLGQGQQSGSGDEEEADAMLDALLQSKVAEKGAARGGQYFLFLLPDTLRQGPKASGSQSTYLETQPVGSDNKHPSGRPAGRTQKA
jgi:hypothetical protein